MPSINYRDLRRYNLNSFVWYRQPLNEVRTLWDCIKACAAQTPRSRRLWVSGTVSFRVLLHFRSQLKSVSRGGAGPQCRCHHRKYQTPKATKYEENIKWQSWEGLHCITRGKHWYHYFSLPLWPNQYFSPYETLIFVTITQKCCKLNAFFLVLHLWLNQYWYSAVPWLLHAVWFMPTCNTWWQARGAVCCVQSCEANPRVNETLWIWFPLPLYWQARGNVWSHIQIKAKCSATTRPTLHSFHWVLTPRGHLKVFLYRWVEEKC